MWRSFRTWKAVRQRMVVDGLATAHAKAPILSYEKRDSVQLLFPIVSPTSDRQHNYEAERASRDESIKPQYCWRDPQPVMDKQYRQERGQAGTSDEDSERNS